MSSGSHLCLLLDLTNYGHYVTHFEASSLVFRYHCVLFGGGDHVYEMVKC